LSNGGERVQLAKPGEVDDNLSFSYIRVEHVRFDDTDPWPTAPDGNGPSLQRVEVTTYADDVANWFSGPSGGTPGAENTLPDTTPPTAPTDLTGTFVGGRSVQLDWTAATDAESGVALYRVYRDGLPVATSTTTTAVDTNVPAGAASQLYVTAVNGDGLEGPRSARFKRRCGRRALPTAAATPAATTPRSSKATWMPIPAVSRRWC